jgi:hypothetical protein
MSNYLVASKLYNTGFIPPSATQLRIKQGLIPQDISNACAYTLPPKSAYAGQTHPQRVPNQTGLYPAKQVQMTYDLPSIPDNCPCLDYIQAP